MWSDTETEEDFLNFSGVAATVAEIIVQTQRRPISIGVSGAWGVGKSSMIRLIRKELTARTRTEGPKFIFVEFNAWLYQGYDDARAALMDVIATKLHAQAEADRSAIDKTKDLLKRVDWLRTAKLAGSVAALAAGVPPVGLVGDLYDVVKKIGAGQLDQGTIQEAQKAATDAAGTFGGFLKPKASTSPPKEIQELRNSFEEALREMGVTLVVLIDDLDRCLPETTISTLEAIRLFLFLENTAFVIAADNQMIKHAVKHHFEGITDDDLVTSYFDKLIQVPIRVPPLGTQEVRAYMMLLFVENSAIDKGLKELIRSEVGERLSQTWQGKRVDRAFVQSLGTLPAELMVRLDTADRLAPLMTKASGINGNPRLIKRFLNALSIRMAISRAHNVGVDEAALVKMLLFERSGNPKAYEALTSAVNADPRGRPAFLADWERKALGGEELTLAEPWNDPFVKEWLALPPALADQDLRGLLYVSREYAPLIAPEDRLSSDGAEVLGALLEQPAMAQSLKSRLVAMPRTETAIIMGRLLDRARQEEEWGAPDILEACLAVSEADPSQGARLGAFLSDLLDGQIRPSIVPKIGDQPWAKAVFDHWSDSDVSTAVKRAIRQRA
ncbi:MAG TPA: P-loop NTPase fold protein [Xanthobacteraceae bacterium]|jgi:predicted KAP-like P-loop ATPase|nr:P-loop NTPase fold protein [Xanthobacteraceae bacterium]